MEPWQRTLSRLFQTLWPGWGTTLDTCLIRYVLLPTASLHWRETQFLKIHLFLLGNYCPICFKCYEDNDYDSQMMQCGTCNHWVHAKCEDLTGECFSLPSCFAVFKHTCLDGFVVGKLLSNHFRWAVWDPVQPARECCVFMSAMQRDSAQCLERAALHRASRWCGKSASLPAFFHPHPAPRHLLTGRRHTNLCFFLF